MLHHLGKDPRFGRKAKEYFEAMRISAGFSSRDLNLFESIFLIGTVGAFGLPFAFHFGASRSILNVLNYCLSTPLCRFPLLVGSSGGFCIAQSRAA